MDLEAAVEAAAGLKGSLPPEAPEALAVFMAVAEVVAAMSTPALAARAARALTA
jgi:hypothetical protein